MLTRRLLRAVVSLGVLYLLLLIPEPDPIVPAGANQRPFVWNRDAYWTSLESQFKEARAVGCDRLAGKIDFALLKGIRLIDEISAEKLAPDDPKFELLETNLFQLAPMIGACSKRVPDFARLFNRVRVAVKDQSKHWDMNSSKARQTIYRLLYGGRAALEELIL